MISKRIPDVRGDVLKKAREAKGLSISELATKVCFSVKQIEQLENGEKSHFYSLAIKANAAKRVADELGLAHEAVFDFGPDLVEGVRAVQNEPTPEPAPAVQDEEKKAPSKKRSHTKKIAEAAVEQKVEHLERFEPPPEPTVKKSRTFSLFAAGILTVAVVLIAFNLNLDSSPVQSTNLTKLPSESITQAGDSKKEEPAVPAPNAQSPAPAAPIPVAQLAPAQAVEGCPPLDADMTNYRPALANKAGNMVHVQTRNAQTICVRDATGKLEKKTLEPGGAYSFYGKAPFVVMTSSLGQTDLFFQGYKVKINNPSAKSIALEEVMF